MDSGLKVENSAISDMLHAVLSDIMEKRRTVPDIREGQYDLGLRHVNAALPPCLTVSVRSAEQLVPELLELRPRVLAMPLELIRDRGGALEPFLEAPDISVAVSLPVSFAAEDVAQLASQLKYAAGRGVTDVMANTLGQVTAAKQLGFTVRGDFGLNVYNSQTMLVLSELGLRSAICSQELSIAQAKALSKALPLEYAVYGRHPVMAWENGTPLSAQPGYGTNSGITDIQGFNYPVVKEINGKNLVLGTRKIWMADRPADITESGLWGARIMFTSENAKECSQIISAYAFRGEYRPGGTVRDPFAGPDPDE
ncbi:MAG: U32 family peptidase [Oscillospiraceae bacterium]|nr:U32 family peptidase [Oscillospiraceae bacterium]